MLATSKSGTLLGADSNLGHFDNQFGVARRLRPHEIQLPKRAIYAWFGRDMERHILPKVMRSVARKNLPELSWN